MDRNTFWHRRCALGLVLLCLLLPACEALPSDSPRQIERGWERQMQQFWDQSLGKLIDPAAQWLEQKWAFVKEAAPQLAARAWDWTVSTAQNIWNWITGAPSSSPPAGPEENLGAVHFLGCLRSFT